MKIPNLHIHNNFANNHFDDYQYTNNDGITLKIPEKEIAQSYDDQFQQEIAENLHETNSQSNQTFTNQTDMKSLQQLWHAQQIKPTLATYKQKQRYENKKIQNSLILDDIDLKSTKQHQLNQNIQNNIAKKYNYNQNGEDIENSDFLDNSQAYYTNNNSNIQLKKENSKNTTPINNLTNLSQLLQFKNYQDMENNLDHDIQQNYVDKEIDDSKDKQSLNKNKENQDLKNKIFGNVQIEEEFGVNERIQRKAESFRFIQNMTSKNQLI
ncbi:hypothetical protein PPERSA_01063 [Pseudocohnilembus persalinus]|uniref:Uncharacterized protein n=1 Tax=Pseudocohnilembus persalinus TaxID=266149 RepID=A0A0V0QUU9_PSEPJ|nr:hypothetical protein PPERSA_01063 [Pseudocohnilembus persalinus]|eukprot:KRX05985.1 hypothetical protein PPERSA_01063 [Pseudocohnilembus persalinus]